VGDLADEGVWAHNARNFVLFGQPIIDDFTQPLFAVPLNTLSHIFSFKLFGVGLAQARITSVLAGWLTLVFLFVFLSKAWNRKAAIICVLILGLNNAFFTYNRLAINVSLLSLFLLLSFICWHKGRDNRFFFLLSGICFGLAVLSKVTAIYSGLAFLLLWLFEYVRKEIKLRNIFLFCFAAPIPIIPYLLYLHKNWGLISINFNALSNYGILHKVIPNFFRLLANNFFGLPTVWILIVLTVLFLIKKNRFDVKSLDFVSMMSISWLFGILVSLIFSDLHDRRFFSLVIPLAILSTKLILERDAIDFTLVFSRFKQKIARIRFWGKLMYALLLSVPVVSLVIPITTLASGQSIEKYGGINGIAITLFFGTAMSILFLFYLFKNDSQGRFIHFLILSNVLLLMVIPALTLVRNFSTHLAIITSTMDKELFYMFTFALVLMLIMFFYLFSTFVKRELLVIGPHLIFLIAVFYFIVTISLIGLTLVAPSYSVIEESHSLDLIIGPDRYLASSAPHYLSMESRYFPVFLAKDRYVPINRNFDKNKINYVTTRETVNGRPVSGKPYVDPEDFQNVKLVKRIKLFPYPFTDKYRKTMLLFSVEGYGGNVPSGRKNTIFSSKYSVFSDER